MIDSSVESRLKEGRTGKENKYLYNSLPFKGMTSCYGAGQEILKQLDVLRTYTFMGKWHSDD